MRSQEEIDSAQTLATWKPHLLYLVPSPYSRLHVEVDAVEGNEPTDVALEKLRGFLSAHCKKADGINIDRSDVIPAEAARGISPEALARKYINGPGKTNPSPAAFMYVLYYNYPLSRNSSADQVLHRGARTIPVPRPQNANPYTDVYFYPAIYFNTAYSLGIAMNEILLHEAGHALGLVRRPTHARNGHCLNRACQMNGHGAFIREFRWLPRRKQSPLCAECIAELTYNATQSPPANLRYVGPVLVRSEANYHVASLPERVGIIVGNITERDCDQFATAMRPQTPDRGDDGRSRVHCLVKDGTLKDPGKLSDIVARLKDDPFPLVRHAGPNVFLRACASRYKELRQYANAINACVQAIALYPKDHWMHNQLAWMQATCPDGSVRNGTNAIFASNKACELTKWRNWRYIDTLAAAHAEVADFKRAIDFQQRALRTGSQTASEHKAMRERLSLYKQSQPFREKFGGS